MKSYLVVIHCVALSCKSPKTVGPVSVPGRPVFTFVAASVSSASCASLLRHALRVSALCHTQIWAVIFLLVRPRVTSSRGTGRHRGEGVTLQSALGMCIVHGRDRPRISQPSAAQAEAGRAANLLGNCGRAATTLAWALGGSRRGSRASARSRVCPPRRVAALWQARPAGRDLARLLRSRPPRVAG